MCLAKTEVEKPMVKSFIYAIGHINIFMIFFSEEAMHGKGESKE